MVNAQPMRTRPNGPSAQRTATREAAETADLWHVQLANGEVRVVTLDKLDDLFRYDVIDDKVFVWQKGMTNWLRLSDLLGAEDDANSDMVHVELGPGNVKEVTLEQLGDYFRYGTVNGSTPVWKAGMPHWTHLATFIATVQREQEERARAAAAQEPEDPFHVLVSPGNVKEVTLEQLDDFYKYGVIDESTMVWQKGMSDWQPLGKVAGIEAEPEAPASTMRPIHKEVQRAPVAVLVPSAPPVSFSIAPPREVPEQRRSWTVRLAIAAGIILGLTRNDVVYAAIGGTALAQRYVSLEQRYLGGPAFGTPRAVEQLVASSGGHLEPVRLPISVSQFTDSNRAAAAKTTEPAARAATPPPAPIQAKAESVSSSAAPATSVAQVPPRASAAALGGAAQPTLAAAAKRANTPPSSAKPSRAKARSSNKSVLKSGGSYFDPLNPSL